MGKKKRRLYQESEIKILLLETVDLLTGSGDGEEDRKEGRLNESVPGPQAVPEGLQEQLARAAEDVELGAVVAVHGEAVAARLLRS